MANHHDTFSRIEAGAHAGAFGHNPMPTPSQAQCEAGNYKVGRISLYGLAIAIEQPRNSFRSGIDPSGKEWRCRLAAHYGYLSGTKGADGDAVDCFIGPWPQADTVYVINQNVRGEFDEHKCMLGFPSEDLARRAYMDSYDRGWDGLKSLVAMSVPQFKWWLKHGNMSRPAVKDYLPFEGHESMKTTKKVHWGHNAIPLGMTLDQVLYEIRRDDAEDGLVFDSVSAADFREIADEVMTLDALVTPYAFIERTMNGINNVMKRTGSSVQPLAFQIADPYRFRGVVNVAVIWELSDGQTVTVLLHNPDSTPSNLAPNDELISWKWLLNKKDITIVVAPERGRDLNVREVAGRIMRLAEKNSAAFGRANSRRKDRMDRIQALKDEISGMEGELAGLLRQIEVAEVEKESAAAQIYSGMPDRMAETAAIDPNGTTEAGNLVIQASQRWLESNDPTTPEGYAKVMADETLMLASKDILDPFFHERLAAFRDYLRNIGWEGRAPEDARLYKGDSEVDFTFRKVGENIVGYSANEIADDLTKTPEELAAQVDAEALAETARRQEAIAQAAADEAAKVAAQTEVVTLTGNELGDFPDTEDGKKALREAAKGAFEAILGQWAPCPALDSDVELRKSGMKKTFSVSADARKLKLIPALVKLIGTAKKITSKPSYAPEREIGVEAYHYMRSVANLAGEEIAVRFVIKEDNNGKFHWDHTVHVPEATFDSTNGNGPDFSSPSAATSDDGGTDPSRLASGQLDSSVEGNANEVNAGALALDDANGHMVFNLFIEGEMPEVVDEEDQGSVLSMADIADQLKAIGWEVSLDERSLMATIYGGDSGAIDVSVSWHFGEDGKAVDIDQDRLNPDIYPTAQAIARYIDEELRYYDDAVVASTKDGAEFAGKTFEFAKSAMIVRDTVRRLGGDTHFGDFNYSMSEGLFDGAGEEGSDETTIPTLPYGICAQIITNGNGIARARIDEQGETIIYAGMSGHNPVEVGGVPAVATVNYSGIVDMVEILFSLSAQSPDVSQVANDPPAVVDPAPIVQPQPEPTADDLQKLSDRELFQSLIDGTVADIGDPGLADQLEAAFMRHQEDSDMAALFEKAVDAYQAAMLAATANLA